MPNNFGPEFDRLVVEFMFSYNAFCWCLWSNMADRNVMCSWIESVEIRKWLRRGYSMCAFWRAIWWLGKSCLGYLLVLLQISSSNLCFLFLFLTLSPSLSFALSLYLPRPFSPIFFSVPPFSFKYKTITTIDDRKSQVCKTLLFDLVNTAPR